MSFEIVFKALKSDLPILRYVNLNIRNYAQTLVKCLPLFAYTEKSVLPRSGPFSQVLSHILMMLDGCGLHAPAILWLICLQDLLGHPAWSRKLEVFNSRCFQSIPLL